MAASSTDRKTLPLREVERALRTAWRESEGGEPRLSTGTLCVVSPPARRREVLAALDDLQGAVPCRSVVAIVGEGKGKPSAEAGVVRRAYGPSCERVLLRLAAADLPGAVLPLAAPDLPVVLWWLLPPKAGGPAPHDLGADRLILDSREAGFPHAPEAEVQDLAWERLSGWRRALASVFEPAQRREHALRLERVEIAVGRGGPDSDGWLLAGWLGARLGWGKGAVADGSLGARGPAGPVEVTVRRTAAKGAASSAIHSVLLAAGEATYVARAEPDGEHAVLEAQPEGIAWRLPLGTAGTGALLGRAFTSPPSQDWSRALERLRAWGIA